MVVVEDHDGADHTAGHHDHDAGEVGSYQRSLTAGRLHAGDHVHEHRQGHQHSDLQGHLLSGVGREVEPEHGHTEMIISLREVLGRDRK